MNDIFFYIFSVINLLALKNIYWPFLRNHIEELVMLQSLLKSWQLVFVAYMSFLIVLTRQWWLKTAEAMNDNKYLITHVLNGKVVKFVIKPAVKKLKAVVNESYEECYLEEAEPFFRYQTENFYPEMINVSEPLFIHFDESEIIHVFPKNKETNEVGCEKVALS